jgi:hypothetical protein
MMKHLAFLSLFGLVFLLATAACESSGGGAGGGADTAGGNGSDTGGGGNGDDAAGGDTGGGGNGGSCRQPVLPAAQNHPWTEFSHGGATYALNSCTLGNEAVQGAWAFFCPQGLCDSGAVDPSYKELLTFNGNTWRARMMNDAEDGYAQGWYFCADQQENDKAVWVFVVTNAVPDGIFGNHEGDVFSADVLGRQAGMTSFYMYYYEGIATQATDDQYYDAFYCRVGSDLDGGEGCCANPFPNE